MRKITHSLIVATAMLSLGVCPHTASAVCKCKVHRHKSSTCECSGHVPARRPNCSCHEDAYGFNAGEEHVVDPTEQDAAESAPQESVDEVVSEPAVTEPAVAEPSVEENAPVEKAIEETPSEAPSGLQPIEAEPAPASAPNEVPAPINPLPESDGLSASPSDASQHGSPATKRLRDALNTKRPYAQPTLDKVPNPPVPDTTEVQLREIPVEFDSYGYLRARPLSPQTSAIGSSYQTSQQTAGRSVVTWSATGTPIK